MLKKRKLKTTSRSADVRIMVKQMKEKCSGGVPTTQGSARGRAPAVLLRCWSTTTLTLYHLFVLEFENIWTGCGREKRKNCETTTARSLWAYCWAVNGLKICVLTIFYKINRCPRTTARGPRSRRAKDLVCSR